jgi:hypothetical protein
MSSQLIELGKFLVVLCFESLDMTRVAKIRRTDEEWGRWRGVVIGHLGRVVRSGGPGVCGFGRGHVEAYGRIVFGVEEVRESAEASG